MRDGRVVRLAQGDYARETRYAADPLAQALAYADAGARWLHLVDLDAAREGGYTLLPLLRAIAEDGRLQVQTGGGVRSATDAQRMFDAGASRIVVGSLAVQEPQQVAGWLARFGAERITIDKQEWRILPDLTSAQPTDARSEARRALDDLRAALRRWLASQGTVAEYEIAGRRMRFASAEDILKRIHLAEAEVARELQDERAASGLAPRRRLLVRY